MADRLTNNILTLMGSMNECRLTLETGVAVSTTDQLAKTSIFLTPFRGNRLALFDGTAWGLYSITADKSIGLGTLANNSQYDVFGFDSGGNVALELSAAWTNDTTRADALALQDGIKCKSGALTRRYLGTIRTTTTTTTEDSAVKRYLYNEYNQRSRSLTSAFISDSHSYTTGAWQEWHAGTNSVRLQFVLGAAGPVAFGVSAGGTAGASFWGIGQEVDITSNPGGLAFSPPVNTASFRDGAPTSYADLAAGFHFIAVVEFGGTGDTFGDYNHVAQLLI
jgi:hypothetical protein